MEALSLAPAEPSASHALALLAIREKQFNVARNYYLSVLEKNQNHRTPASKNREAGNPETFDLSAHIPALREGNNVFAIEVHNRELGSSDLSIIPKLVMADGGVKKKRDAS